MQGIVSAYGRDPAQDVGVRPAEPEPIAPTLGEVVSANFGLARDDTTGIIEQRRMDAYGPIVNALTEVTGKPLQFYVNLGRNGDPVFADNIWRDIAEVRARDPAALKGVAKDQASFQSELMGKMIAARRANEDVAARSLGVLQTIAGFGASVAGTMTDPVNIVMLPFGGGGKTIGQVFAREALVNGAVELALQPTVAANRRAYGEELTLREGAANVGLAAIGGGTLGVAGKVGVDGYRLIADRIRPLDRKLADALTSAEPGDGDIAQAFELLAGDAATPDQRGAVAVLRRQAEVDAASPFVGNAAGGEAQAARLAETIEALLAGRAVPPVSRGTSPAERPAAAPAAGGGARGALKAAIRGVESGGNDAARNPLSSATGRYQFIDATWLAYHRRVIGGELSDAERLAQRGDGAVQDRLMDALVDDNARALFRAGHAETAGNLYLAHFAGPKGAVRLLDADPDAPAAAVLGARAVAANPFLRGMTAGDAIAWAHRKMGEPAIGGAERLRLDAGRFGDDEDALRAAQADLDAAEMAALLARGEEADAPVTGIEGRDDPASLAQVDPIDLPLTPWRGDDDPDLPGPSPAAASRAPAAPSVDSARLDALAEQVRTISRGGRSLAPERVAATIGEDVATAQQLLTQIALEPGSGLRVSRKGRVSRMPRRTAAPDVLRVLAEQGGVRDDGGHALTKGRVSGRTGKARSGRDMGRAFVPSVGAVFRKDGMSIDDAGELLFERGFFRERPSEAEVLDVLERAVNGGERIYAAGDEADALAREAAEANAAAMDGARDEADTILRAALDAADIDPDLIEDVAVLILQGAEPIDAVSDALRWRLIADADMVHDLTGEPIHDWRDTADFDAEDAGRDGGQFRGGDDEPGAGPSGAGRGGEEPADGGGLSEADWQRYLDQPELIEADARAFDDPHGKAARDQAESLEHDVAMAIDRGVAVDPAVVARQRQQAALKAGSTLQSTAEQESMIGSPLFDAVDQPQFRLDEEGGETGAREVLADLDAEARAIAAARGCMTPPARDGGDG